MHPHPREPAPTQEVRDQNAGEVGLRVGPGLHVEVKHLVVPLLGRESPAKIVLVEGVRPAFKKPYEILLDGNGWQSLHEGNGERNSSGDGKGDAPYSEGR